MGMAGRQALVIGGGIAGPAAAIALARAGILPTVFEADADPESAGSLLLGVAPNGLRGLELLGVQGLDEAGHLSAGNHFVDVHGRHLGTIEAPARVIRRSELRRVLLRELDRRGIPVVPASRFDSVDDRGEAGVRAYFADGSSAVGDFLLGCDGLRSRVRRHVAPETPWPTFAGLVTVGGFADRVGRSYKTGMLEFTIVGTGTFIHYGTAGGEVMWAMSMVSTDPWPSPRTDAGQEQVRRRLLTQLEHAPAHLRSVVDATDRLERLPLSVLEPVGTWYRRNVCLLGDAAHAMLPHAGQGASMAIEDAIVLGRCLRDAPTAPIGFAAYRAARAERVAHVHRLARRNRPRTPPPNAPARWMRDHIVPVAMKVGLRQMAAMYDYRIAWDEPSPGRDPLSTVF
ncbi:FAD-binding monooxygenase [Parafrankia sp. BMG5.11]|nr:FAD-binding monooxygenase [Parafrankia sp. BMG5.11]SQE00424.1 Monooxygenase FAD-binding [Parafrankia sp. Ea1.12]